VAEKYLDEVCLAEVRESGLPGGANSAGAVSFDTQSLTLKLVKVNLHGIIYPTRRHRYQAGKRTKGANQTKITRHGRIDTKAELNRPDVTSPERSSREPRRLKRWRLGAKLEKILNS
jgi:hypothetical protein